MLDPHLLYTVNPAQAATLTGHRPVLLHLLDGYMDGGQVGAVIDAHLTDQCEHEVLVEFDHDQVHDYRAHRPTMVYHNDHWQSVSGPRLKLHRMLDDRGTPFLLLRGSEPGQQWERVAAAVVELCRAFDVRLAATVAGAPMAVPHTRPLIVSAHATDRSLLLGEDAGERWANVEVPGSFSAFLEYTLGQAGIPAGGHFVHVPHYLAQTAYLEAAEVGLARLLRFTGLHVSGAALTELAGQNRAQIDAELAESAEAREIVAGLEVRYDTEAASRVRLTSGDQLAAEFERFLADQPETDIDE